MRGKITTAMRPYRGADVSMHPGIVTYSVLRAMGEDGYEIRPCSKCRSWANSFTEATDGTYRFWYDAPTGSTHVLHVDPKMIWEAL